MSEYETAKAPNAKVARPVKGKGGIWPWLFVAPLLSGVAIFYYYPIIKNFYLSLLGRMLLVARLNGLV